MGPGRERSRGLFALMAALVLCGPFAAPTAVQASSAGRRIGRIVLFTVDTLRADRLGCYGYTRRPTTPHIDAWARGAVLFERAYAQAPWTVPSLGSLMTGRYPVEAGVYTNRGAIAPRRRTLAERFKAAGFRTAMFNTHRLLIRAAGGFPRGFDLVHPTSMNLPPTVHKLPFGRIRQALLDWLASHANDRFFLWVHDMDPHHPPTEDNPYLRDPAWKGYDGEVRWVDEAFSAVETVLRDQGVLDSTLLIFTADHGEAFGEHGIPGHQDVMYDEVLHVPLILRYPGMPGPRRIREPVELLDLHRTILELAGAPVDPSVRGEDLLALIEGRSARRRASFVHSARYHFEDGHHELAVRDREWKLLVRTPDRNRHPPANRGARERTLPRWDAGDDAASVELYHYPFDPEEKHEKAAAQPQTVRRLRAALAAWTAQVAENPGPARAPKLDDPAREALRMLGYGP